MQRNTLVTDIGPDGPDTEQSRHHPIDRRLSPASDAEEIEIAGRRYVRQGHLATILKVTPRTLARWDAQGIGPPKIKIGKTVLFDLAKLPDWLATRETMPTRNTHP